MKSSKRKSEAPPQGILEKLKNLPAQQVTLTPEEMYRIFYWLAKSTSASNLGINAEESKSETRIIRALGLRLERLTRISLEEIVDGLIQQEKEKKPLTEEDSWKEEGWELALDAFILEEISSGALGYLAKGVMMGKFYCDEELVRCALEEATAKVKADPSEPLEGVRAELGVKDGDFDTRIEAASMRIGSYLDHAVGKE